MRRAGLACLVALALVAGSMPAAGQVPPSISLSPNCGPERASIYEITVAGQGFTPGTTVAVDFDTEAVGTFDTDGSGRFTGRITPKGRPAGTYTVRATDTREREASAPFRVPCPSSTTTSTASTTTSTSTTAPKITTTSTAGRVTTTSTAVRTTTTTTALPLAAATLVVEPPLGPPGFVALARGLGFPPGPVSLAWSPGLGSTDAVAGADGGFAVPVLVFHRDALGPRILTAVGAGGARATAPFLVVPGQQQPGRFVARR